jgi:hypothetical protein
LQWILKIIGDRKFFESCNPKIRDDNGYENDGTYSYIYYDNRYLYKRAHELFALKTLASQDFLQEVN